MGLVLRIRIGCKKHCSGIIEASVNPVIVRKKEKYNKYKKVCEKWNSFSQTLLFLFYGGKI